MDVSPAEGFDLYAWAAPRDLSAEAAADLVEGWLAAGGDPAASPFEPSTDVAWFYRELTKDLPDIDAVSDGAPNTRSRPIFLETDDPPPARVVAIRLTRDLGVNLAGIEIILKMRRRMQEMQHQLEDLTSHVRSGMDDTRDAAIRGRSEVLVRAASSHLKPVDLF